MNEQAPETSRVQSIAKVETASASRYLQQLCKHIGHKRPVTFNERSGEVGFTIGECRLDAEDNVLTMTLMAPDDAQLIQSQDVIKRHLVRFAFREELQINWHST